MRRMDSSGRLLIDVRETLAFFDEVGAGSRGHVSSVVAVLGEDLGAALLQRCLLETRGVSTRVLMRDGRPLTPTTGERKGRRLDRWLLGTGADGGRTLFQVEIKNWSATAIGHGALALDADDDARSAFGARSWARYWSEAEGAFAGEHIGKVLHKMSLPPHDVGSDGRRVKFTPPLSPSEVVPVVCFWSAVRCSEGMDALAEFRLPAAVGDFDRLLVFSMSNYLRGVGEGTLELEMPSAARRIGWLNRLCATV